MARYEVVIGAQRMTLDDSNPEEAKIIQNEINRGGNVYRLGDETTKVGKPTLVGRYQGEEGKVPAELEDPSLANQPWFGTTGFQTALVRFRSNQPTADEPGEQKRRAESLNRAATTFTNLFQQDVGREPTPDEMGQFFSLVVRGTDFYSDQDPAATPEILRERTKTFVVDTFQREAEEQARTELEEQQGEATRLADVFRQQQMGAIGRFGEQLETGIGQTEQQLLDYQQRLFERLRPQLLTQLQTQGLLNTGALNVAMAGAMRDLSEESQRQLLGMRAGTTEEIARQRLAAERGAQQIAMGAQALPLQFQQQLALSRIPQLQQEAQTALQRAFQRQMGQIQFGQQQRILGMQPTAPSPLWRLGGTLLGGALGAFGGPAGMAAGATIGGTAGQTIPSAKAGKRDA